MKAYPVGLHMKLREIVKNEVEEPLDSNHPTPLVSPYTTSQNAHAASALLSALSGEEYNKVIGLEVTNDIWDTLHIAHEGADKVRQ